MIDDDDVSFTVLAMSDSSAGSWLTVLITLIVVGIVWSISSSNNAECEKQHCAHGQAKLLEGECVCVGTPVK